MPVQDMLQNLPTIMVPTCSMQHFPDHMLCSAGCRWHARQLQRRVSALNFMSLAEAPSSSPPPASGGALAVSRGDIGGGGRRAEAAPAQRHKTCLPVQPHTASLHVTSRQLAQARMSLRPQR